MLKTKDFRGANDFRIKAFDCIWFHEGTFMRQQPKLEQLQQKSNLKTTQSVATLSRSVEKFSKDSPGRWCRIGQALMEALVA